MLLSTDIVRIWQTLPETRHGAKVLPIKTKRSVSIMPYKSGRLTPLERGVIKEMAVTGSVAATAAKIGASEHSVYQAAQRPAVQAEIARQTQKLLFEDILPLAVSAHRRILTDPRAPAGAVVQAVKLAYDRTLGSDEAGKGKEPHEMTPDELAQSIATLERIAAARAKPVNPPSIDEEATPEPDIFE
jgi:hypothetical protein